MSEPDKSGEEPRPRITPARPAQSEESAGYMPRLPWRWILLGTLSVMTVMGGYFMNERRKADRLRAQIVQVHEQELAEPARRYLELRDRLEGWVTTVAARVPQSQADPRLRISGLRSGKGLYLRLSVADARTRKGIAKGAQQMEADAIASCLGLAPASARAIWEKGAFLTPDWLKVALKNDSVMGLRVTDTVLARHIRADLPTVLNLLRSDWFLLVLQHGDDRRDQPVDVFLWDVRSGQQLLRGHIQASGVLMPVRVRSKDAPPAPRLPPSRLLDGAANDCSIAAQIKQLAGLPLASVENVAPPSPTSSGAGTTQATPAATTGSTAPALRGGASSDTAPALRGGASPEAGAKPAAAASTEPAP
jgi:hypothetical protein